MGNSQTTVTVQSKVDTKDANKTQVKQSKPDFSHKIIKVNEERECSDDVGHVDQVQLKEHDSMQINDILKNDYKQIDNQTTKKLSESSGDQNMRKAQKTVDQIEKLSSKYSIKSLKKIDDIYKHYKIGKVIGKGSYGKVRKAESKLYGYKCAIKYMKKSNFVNNSNSLSQVMSEMSVLESVSHPNLIRTYELLHDNKYLYIVQELAQQSDFLKFYCERLDQGNQLYNEQQVKFVIKQLLSSIQYLHERHIIHRDVKLQNILITGFHQAGPIIKLTDYGFAKILTKNETLTQQIGSLPYLAPEILDKKPYSLKVDIWSTMVVIFNIYTGKMPFQGTEIHEIKREVQYKDMDTELHQNQKLRKLSPLAKDFMMLGFQKNPNNRASAQNLLSHAWLKDTQLPKEIPPPKSNNEMQTAILLRAGHQVPMDYVIQLYESIQLKDQHPSVLQELIQEMSQRDFDKLLNGLQQLQYINNTQYVDSSMEQTAF